MTNGMNNHHSTTGTSEAERTARAQHEHAVGVRVNDKTGERSCKTAQASTSTTDYSENSFVGLWIFLVT